MKNTIDKFTLFICKSQFQNLKRNNIIKQIFNKLKYSIINKGCRILRYILIYLKQNFKFQTITTSLAIRFQKINNIINDKSFQIKITSLAALPSQQYSMQKQENLIMSEQTFFGEELEQIQKTYIKTSYGNIFSYVVGKRGQPLIIIVHGSGPKNSADQYLYLLHEYLVRISYIEKYYIIAIDCPGYGRSKGSKEAVKTFPLQMFKEILKELGYQSYYAMLGHSQGGAAIFNAVHEDPSITQFLLMDRPVCGNIKRFSKFPTPTLLVYDIEDDGHPIWQGKLLYKQLLVSEFYTYRNSQNCYYVPDNLWNFMLKLFKKYGKSRKNADYSKKNENSNRFCSEEKKKEKYKQNSEEKYKNRTISLTKYEQIKKQKSYIEQQLKEIQQIDKSQLHSLASKAASIEELEDLPTWLNQPKVEQTEEEIMMQREVLKKKQQNFISQFKSQRKEEHSEEKKQTKVQNQIPKQQKIYPQDSNQKQKSELKEEANQSRCSICHQQYYYPIQTNCKHTFCKKCLGESLLVDQRCPLCRTKVTKKQKNQNLHNILCQKMTQKQKDRRQKQLNQFETMLKSIVYIEIGNTSRILETKKSPFTKTKTKYVWELYAKEPKNFKFQQVHFNINMGEVNSKPVKVGHAPFVFESRGTFSFSCQITIKPKNKDYDTIISIYRINVEPGNHSKMIAIKKKKK